MPNEKSLANLTPWKPGESGNPSGRNFATYRREVEQLLVDALEVIDDDGRSQAKAILDRLLADAKAGKPHAMKLVLERILPAVTKAELELPGVDAAGLAIALEAERDAEWAEFSRRIDLLHPARLDEVVEILDEAKALGSSDVYEN
jgi:hypothetical protein